MENDTGGSGGFWLIIGLFIGYQIIAHKIRWTNVKGKPILGLEIEWPKSHQGRLLVEGKTLIEFPLHSEPASILKTREKKYGYDIDIALADYDITQQDTLDIEVEYSGERPPGCKKPPEIEIELGAYFVQDNGKFLKRQLEEKEFYPESSGQRKFQFSAIQRKLRPLQKKISDNLTIPSAASPETRTSTNSNKTVERR